MKAIIAAGLALLGAGVLAGWLIDRESGVEHWRTMGEDDGASEGMSAKENHFSSSPRGDLAMKNRMTLDDSTPSTAEKNAYLFGYSQEYLKAYKS